MAVLDAKKTYKNLKSKLSKEQFKDLANCPLSESEYLQILKENEIIEEN